MPVVPALLVDDVVEITQFAVDDLTGCQIINRHHARVTAVPATPTSTVLQAAIAYAQSFFNDFQPLSPNDYHHLKTVAKVIISVSQETPTSRRPHPFKINYSFGAESLFDWIGTNPGVAMPVINTVSIPFKTALVGRYWRGGMHLSPINASTVAPANLNKITGPAQVAYSNAMLSYRGATVLTGGTTMQMEIFSPTYCAWVSGFPLVPALSCTPIIQSVANEYVRHQLSRQAPHVP